MMQCSSSDVSTEFDPGYLQRLMLAKELEDRCLPAHGGNEELRSRLVAEAATDPSVTEELMSKIDQVRATPLCVPTKSGQQAYELGKQIREENRRKTDAAALAKPVIQETAQRIVECSRDLLYGDILRARQWLAQPQVRERLERDLWIHCKIIDRFEDIREHQNPDYLETARNLLLMPESSVPLPREDAQQSAASLSKMAGEAWRRIRRAWTRKQQRSVGDDDAGDELHAKLRSEEFPSADSTSSYSHALTSLCAGMGDEEEEERPDDDGNNVYDDDHADMRFSRLIDVAYAVLSDVRRGLAEHAMDGPHVRLVVLETEEAIRVLEACKRDERAMSERRHAITGRLECLDVCLGRLVDAVLDAAFRYCLYRRSSDSWMRGYKGKWCIKDRATMASELAASNGNGEAKWIGVLWTVTDRELKVQYRRNDEEGRASDDVDIGAARRARKQIDDDIIAAYASAVFACGWLARLIVWTDPSHEKRFHVS